ncbi:thyrotropin-releasing hormone receptor-like [Patiria miniata]|uniref:G-protein coupled receptors family 1 profile domain-containing protein n=1 Tax=Patiria miniata TaxID=46514 RepID=A0A913Z775_PATMI|nr:thyrotropin-releasing hormone receptor-like [Patiria miniata]
MDQDFEVNKSSECSRLPLMNLTLEEDASIYLLDNGISTTMLTILFTILAVGIPGNLAFLFVVARVPYMRTITNVYLATLAVADLMFLISSIVQYNFYFTHPVRSHLATASFVGCVGAFFPQYVTYFASISMVSLVTHERYNAICKPFLYHGQQGGTRLKQSLKLVVGSWLVAVGLAGLVMVRYAKLFKTCAIWPDEEPYYDLPVQLGYCVAVSHWGLIVGHVLESIVFIVALITNAIMCTLIIINLNTRVRRKREQNLLTPSSVDTQQALHIRNQVTRMLIANGAVFFLCQTPFIALSLGFLVENLLGVPPDVTYRKLVFALTVCHVFVFLNSAVNPIIYNVTSRHYRQAFVEAFSRSTNKNDHKIDCNQNAVKQSHYVALAVL